MAPRPESSSYPLCSLTSPSHASTFCAAPSAGTHALSFRNHEPTSGPRRSASRSLVPLTARRRSPCAPESPIPIPWCNRRLRVVRCEDLCRPRRPSQCPGRPGQADRNAPRDRESETGAEVTPASLTRLAVELLKRGFSSCEHSADVLHGSRIPSGEGKACHSLGALWQSRFAREPIPEPLDRLLIR